MMLARVANSAVAVVKRSVIDLVFISKFVKSSSREIHGGVMELTVDHRCMGEKQTPSEQQTNDQRRYQTFK
jgi:hypothetical protein